MKKVVCLVVALVLCMTSCVFAESIPSRTTSDMTKVEILVGDKPAPPSMFIKPVLVPNLGDLGTGEPGTDAPVAGTPEAEVYMELIEKAETEITKMAEAESIEDYFGVVKDVEGNVHELSVLLDVQEDENLNVFDFFPMVAGGFEEEEEVGDVTVVMTFPTVYEEDEEVLVLIGFVTTKDAEEVTLELNEDGTIDPADLQEVEWIFFEGIGVETEIEEEGAISVLFPELIVKRIQEEVALMAVVSKSAVDELLGNELTAVE